MKKGYEKFARFTLSQPLVSYDIGIALTEKRPMLRREQL